MTGRACRHPLVLGPLSGLGGVKAEMRLLVVAAKQRLGGFGTVLAWVGPSRGHETL